MALWCCREAELLLIIFRLSKEQESLFNRIAGVREFYTQTMDIESGSEWLEGPSEWLKGPSEWLKGPSEWLEKPLERQNERKL